MKPIRRARLAVLAALFLLTAATVSGGDARQGGLLERLVAVETVGAVALCPPSNGGTGLRERIESLISEARVALATSHGGHAVVETLNDFIFDRFGVHPSRDLNDPKNLCLSSVLERKQGYCVGIAALYLVLSERLGLPIFAVATPSHVFLRYDDGTTRINIETLQQGANVPDEGYIREQKIPDVSIRKGVFMRNLTAEEFLAQVHNNLGVIYSEREAYHNAAAEYGAALTLHPMLPATLYNLGNDLLQQGEFRRAIRLFSKSLRLYPTDVWALNNRGLAYMKIGKAEKARRDLEDALRIEPGFGQARRNLESLQKDQPAAE